MGAIKDIWDIAQELPAIRRRLSERDEREERRKLLHSFSPDFCDDPSTALFDYFRWNDEAEAWNPKDGELRGTSYKEIDRLWSDQSFYSIYEAGLVRFINAGGVVNRTIVVSSELFNPTLELLLLRTGLRQSMLGIPPMVAHRLDIANTMNRLNINTQMLGVVGAHTAYFMRASPIPMAVKTKNKKIIGRAWECYNDMTEKTLDFMSWVKSRNFVCDPKSLIADLEKECQQIKLYAAKTA